MIDDACPACSPEEIGDEETEEKAGSDDEELI